MLAHLDELVVKPANESGGYGVFVGSDGDRGREGRGAAAGRGRPPQLHRPADPAGSPPRRRSATGGSRPAHLDLRPVHPLRRAALRHPGRAHPRRAAEGSLVVNSSQGGGSKDTWVVDPTVVPAGARLRPAAPSRSPSRRPRPRSTDAAVPRRRARLLGRPLPRAGRGHRPAGHGPHRALPRPAQAAGVGWAPLLAVTGSDEAFRARHDRADEEDVVGFLAADARAPGLGRRVARRRPARTSGSPGRSAPRGVGGAERPYLWRRDTPTRPSPAAPAGLDGAVDRASASSCRGLLAAP